LVKKVAAFLSSEHQASSFNIGINNGIDAGQTIAHAHIHVIPRYKNDVEDPRGGVRNILPDKSGYLNKTINVVAGVIKKDGKFLIARRAKHKHMGGFWEYAGGKVEEGESDEESLQRELHEEFGISVQVKQHLLNSFFRYEKVNVNLKAYLVEHLSGEFILKDHDAICWITPEEFKDYEFAPADVPFNEYIIQHDI
jgi:8-oxo-dGTP diphosphatase